MDPKIFDDLAKKLADSVPSGLKTLQGDMEKNFHSVLQSTFNKLDLVTREEFEVQANVLARTRSKLDELQKQVDAMEQALQDKK
ncbi:accessory factor UbiK family protein [Pseudomonadota bacterium]